MTPRLPFIAAAIAATLLAAAPSALAQAPAPTGGATFGAGDGLTVAAGTLLGTDLTISGSLPSAAGQRVRIEREDPATGQWAAIARATADDDGGFSATWDTDVAGAHRLRAVLDTAPAQAVTATSDDAAPSATTTVFKRTRATWYGPGLWGNRTACGIKLTKATLGVAHRTLPCGARVAVFLAGRQIEVPVIDRGPFGLDATLDLTQATAEAIGMTQTVRIGWVRTDVRRARPA